MQKKQRNTSWGNEAKWYQAHLAENDTYHAQVIIPNLMRIVAPKGKTILEIGCGEGFFARACAHEGGTVIASDISKELIAIAQKNNSSVTYHVSPAEDLSWVTPHSCDVVIAVLTLQNMERIEPVFKEVARVLKKDGRFVCVINHPAFRIPQKTAWGYDDIAQVQYRRVDAYLSSYRATIDMHPGQKGRKSFTYSFHRSLQDYVKAFRGTGFAITRLEEWISHRVSEPGLRAKAENTGRKEIPLFMCIEVMQLNN